MTGLCFGADRHHGDSGLLLLLFWISRLYPDERHMISEAAATK